MLRFSDQARQSLSAFLGGAPDQRHWLARYGMAIGLTALALLVRLQVAPVEEGGRFITFALAATLTALYGGFWPALLSTVLGMLLVSYAMIAPYGQWAFQDMHEGVLLNVTFLVNQLLVSAAIAMLRHYQHGQSRQLQSRVQHAEARADAGQFFSDTFEHAAVGIGHASIDGRWLRVNQPLCDLLGYTEEEMLDTNFQRVTHPDHMQATLDNARDLIEGSVTRATLEKRYLRKDGSSVWVSLNSTLMRHEDGTPDYFIAVILDISDRKASEARVREQDRQLEVISNHIPGGIALLDRELHYRYVSREYSRFFKRPTHEIIGMSMQELLGPKAFEKARPHAQRALWGETSRYENHLISADGEEIYIDVTAVPERTDSGKVKGVINVINFITDYKKTELALRRTQHMLLQAQALAHIMTWVYDPATRTYESLGNEAGIIGLTGDSPSLNANQILQQVHPDDREQALQTWSAALRGTGKTYDFTYRGQVQGQTIWLSSRADIERDRLGRAVRAYGVTQNITDARRSEHALRESRELLLKAQAIANVDCWTFDLDKRIFRSVERPDLAGDNRSAHIPWRSFDEVFSSVHPLDREWVTRAWHAAEHGGPAYNVEHRVVSRRGVRWFRAQAEFSFDAQGHATGAIGVRQDITAQKESELALQERTTMLLQAQALANLTNWVFDITGSVYEFGANSGEILGFAKPVVTVQQMLEMVHPEDRAALQTTWIRTLRSRDNNFSFEHRSEIRGQPVWLATRADIIRDAAGRAVRAIGITMNITELKRVEQQVQQINAELEQRVQQRTTALTAANEELESFAYAVAHDLRSPLRAINGFTQALLDESGDRIDDSMRQHFDRITRASRKMGSLIDGLLELSRHSRKQLTPQDIDLSEMAQRVLAELSQADPQRQVRVDIEPGLRVRADPLLMDSLLHNLLENAWKYTARTGQASIRMLGRLEHGRRTIVVSDNGAGFDMAYVHDLFKPFHRLHRDSEFPGVGIGLATSQRIVQRHGGQIRASSAPGQGAQFSFDLPLAETGGASPTSPDHSGPDARPDDGPAANGTGAALR